MSNDDTGAFADLPTGGQNAQAAPPGFKAVGDRPYEEFEIPEDEMGWEWSDSEFDDSARKFGMTEITPGQERQAGKLAGAQMDFNTVYSEQQIMTIYMIGGRKTNKNYKLITRWLTAIGPGGRKIVETCYAKISSVEQSAAAAVADAGVVKRG